MLATLLAVLIGGMAYTLHRKPVFESTAQILVVTNSAGSSAAGSIPFLSDLQALTKSRSIDTQVEVIESADLIALAFHRLGKIPAYDGELDYYGGLNPGKTGLESQRMADILHILRSGPTDPTAGKAASLDEDSDYERSLGDLRRLTGFQGDDTVSDWSHQTSAKKNTDVITVTALAYTKYAAAALANSMADAYFNQDRIENGKATDDAKKAAWEQMLVIESRLKKENSKLTSLKKKTGIIDPATQLAGVAEHMAKLQEDMDTARVEIASNHKSLASMESQLKGQSDKVVSSSTITRNPDFESVIGALNGLYAKRASMIQEYQPGSDEMLKLEAEIKGEESRLKQVAERVVSSETQSSNPVHLNLSTQYSDSLATLSANVARLNALGTTYQERRKEFSNLPDVQSEISDLVQKVALLNNTYELLSQKYYTLLVSMTSISNNGRYVTQAAPPRSYSYPSKRKNAVLFFLLGGLFSIAVALIAEKFDIRLHDQTLAERMTGVPTLSVIPEMPADAPSIISDVDRNSLLLESYRILRNNISFSSIDREVKMLAVTSPGRGEGKSTIATNLAVAMAMDGKKALIVDCDLRRPTLHRKLSVSRDIGFTNVVTGACSLEDAIAPTSIENLYLLPSGPIPPNPTEILNSQRSRQIFSELRDMYDSIIVDCPPCVGLGDVQVVSNLVDGLILLIAMDKTLKPHLHIAMKALTQVEAPLIGLVLNRMEIRRQGYNNYYSYYYYYNYDYTLNGEHRETQSKIERKRNNRSKKQ